MPWPPVLLLGWARPSRSLTPASSLAPVGNARAALNQDTLGIPVIAMGVPTVVDAGTLVAELTGRERTGQEELERMMVTQREVDTVVTDIGRVTGCAISLALQEGLALADLELLLS